MKCDMCKKHFKEDDLLQSEYARDEHDHAEECYICEKCADTLPIPDDY